METGKLKIFAQAARRQLLEDVGTRLEQVLRADSVETREKKAAITELKQQIAQSTKQEVIDRVAYTWFNRFCALRFMDVNHYTRLGIVSPVEGYTQPELLQEAKQGVIDPELKVDRKRVLDILSGKIPSSDPQGEAYRLLLVGACNAYHQLMPFLFEPIADHTELLMPDDLLSENSVLHRLRQALSEETYQDVEVIGWLYQFYISERKDEVFAALKQNQKIEARDIPAATQLFTPHWIVRYLVENSLGRLWMLNYPESKLSEQMEYYIKPEQEETDFLRIETPEEIKICDPACGSGHMLTYAFDLLYDIYEEQGYDQNQIPSLILQKNLYGIEIDKRAGDLAAFALVMKARTKDRRFFSRKVEPNICVLQNVVFTANEIDDYINVVGQDLFTQDLWVTLKQFEQADEFGSLIQPRLKNVSYIIHRLEDKGVFENLFLQNTNRKVQKVLNQVQYLSSIYQVVVTNPPYMGSKGLNSDLREFLKEKYFDVSSDLFSSFVIRCLELGIEQARIGIMSPNVWMYISSYEKLRVFITRQRTLATLVELPLTGFKGATVQICAYTIINQPNPNSIGEFIRLVEFKGGEKEMAEYTLGAIRNPNCKWFFRSATTDFKKIPGTPIAYWITDNVRNAFSKFKKFSQIATAKQGLATGNNLKFLRQWNEVNFQNIIFNLTSNKEAIKHKAKWIPYNKGGEYRKWYGCNDHVVLWVDGGKEIKNYKDENGKELSRFRAANYYFKEAITWGLITSSKFSARYRETGYVFDITGMSVFGDELFFILGLLNSNSTQLFLSLLNPTLAYQIGDIRRVPLPHIEASMKVNQIVKECVRLQKASWDSYETSWGFSNSPLLSIGTRIGNLSETYQKVRRLWIQDTSLLKQLEEENNSLFIEAYGLQDELMPEVSLSEITLTFNPHYRYKSSKTIQDKETQQLADTMKEFISYAVGCMFGRYSLDKPGLILANQGEGIEDFRLQIEDFGVAWEKVQFSPDPDNVIPILEEGWFNDDIAERFKKFLRVTFGDEQYEENLAFIEKAIGRDIRSYFLKDFYDEHVQMYKKRPIYWLFSSPNGSFNALIYMHRYRPDTVAVVLNDYLREYVRKLNAHKSHLEQVSLRLGGSQAEKTKATKEINALNKILAELKMYEDEVLYPLATRQIQIDLDDGVIVNYNKFGKALKSVKGLSE